MLLASSLPQFRAREIGTGLKGGYQVIAVDMTGDGKLDLVALASGLSELVWYENPTWERHVIVGGQTRMINVAAVEQPGKPPVLVLASGFDSRPDRSPGVVSVLEAQGDPRQPWKATEIDRLSTSHRLRTVNVDGRGPAVVNAPLANAQAAPPDYRGTIPLVLYRPGTWKRELIDETNEGVMHGIYALDWDGDGRDEILTASFVGIHLYDFAKDGHWHRAELTKGDPAPWPKCGASDVAVGQLGKRRFLCAIEPWHGHQVTVYRQEKEQWVRQVIDDSMVDGHTIYTGDLNGDGRDEIVAGYRGKGTSVYIFTAEDAEGRRWQRHVLDDKMATAACAVEDLNGDGRPDIACIGTSTANLKIYENLGAAE